METYELTYIISSEMTSGEADALLKEIESFVQSKEGTILKSERTAPKTLAYLIKKLSSGYFCILEFRIEENKVREIKEHIDKNDKILRSLVGVKKITKVVKERRTRRPIMTREFETKRKFDTMEANSKKIEQKTEKVGMEEIEKKLDEILSE